VFIVVLTQRFALPFGSSQIPAVVPLFVGAVGWGLLRGYLRWDRTRVLLGLTAALLLTALAAVAQARGYRVSALSLALLFAIYAVALVVPARIGREAVTAALRAFSTLMTFWATVGRGPVRRPVRRTALPGLVHRGRSRAVRAAGLRHGLSDRLTCRRSTAPTA
jgi:hypothetical protein